MSDIDDRLSKLENLIASLAPAPSVAPPVAPPVATPVAPAPININVKRIYDDVRMFVFGAVAASLIYFVFFNNSKPVPVPEVPVESDFRKFGKTYRGQLAESRAASWELAATQLAAGVKPDTAFKAADDDFTRRRHNSFEPIGAALERIAPNGMEGQGSKLASAFRELAKGIRSK